MDGSGGLDLSGSHDNDEADNILSLLDSCLDWELDSDSVPDQFDNGEGNQVASAPLPSINSQSDELLGLSVDDFMYAILLEELNRRSPPPAATPAARFAVERLTKVVMKVKTDEVCVICHEEVKKGENMYKLPCSHYYHGNCIKQWLKLRNTCPVCRFELPSEKDPKTC